MASAEDAQCEVLEESSSASTLASSSVSHNKGRGRRASIETPWSKGRFIAYGVGHVLNDMCASTWFSYLLVFLRQVALLSPVDSAIVMFCGQIADGAATPLVGVLSDRSKGIPSIGFGRRKTWFAMGSLMVIVCFYFVFATCAPLWFWQTPSRTVMVVYYSIAASLFNFGWAAVQVSHMALVPELSTRDNIRCILNSTRYAFTILSNVLVFMVFFVLLRTVQPLNDPNEEKFTLLAYTTLVVGGVCTIIFLTGTKENISTTLEEVVLRQVTINHSPTMAELKSRGPTSMPFDGTFEQIESDEMDYLYKPMSWKCWFKQWMFYEVGMVYMCTRLVVNVTQVFISFYLIVTLEMSATSIAIVPLLVYVSGFFATFIVRYLNDSLGRTGSFILGSGFVIVALFLSYLLTPETATWIYAFSVVLGMGNSIIMVTSVCLEGDLIGNNVESGAFVYGAMSFTDKVSNGVAILLIQNEREKLQNFPIEDAEFLRQIYCVLPSIAAVIGMLTVLYMYHASGSTKRRVSFPSDSMEETSGLLAHEEQPCGYGTA